MSNEQAASVEHVPSDRDPRPLTGLSYYDKLREVCRNVLRRTPPHKRPPYVQGAVSEFEPHDWVIQAIDAAMRSECNEHFGAWCNTLDVLKRVDPGWKSRRDQLFSEGKALSAKEYVAIRISEMAALAYPPINAADMEERTPKEQAAYRQGIEEGMRRQVVYFVRDDGKMRDLVNGLRQTAVSYHGTQQLRSRIQNLVIDALSEANKNGS